jgi:hypothetical protein
MAESEDRQRALHRYDNNPEGVNGGLGLSAGSDIVCDIEKCLGRTLLVGSYCCR